MAKILVIDPDAPHAAQLVQALRSIGHGVIAYADEEQFLAMVVEDRPSLAIIVLRSPATWRSVLISVCSGLRRLEYRLELLFLLRWKPKGSEDRLLADRWNVAVLHER